jgi:hypothetical protein
MSVGPYSFYYGYEETFCPNHGRQCPDECEDVVWAFVAKIDRNEVFRTGIKEVDDQFNCDECLIEGMRLFIADRLQHPKKA